MKQTTLLIATWMLLMIGVSVLLPGCATSKGDCPGNNPRWFYEHQGVKRFKQPKHADFMTHKKVYYESR